MVSLYDAVKLTGGLDDDASLVYLKKDSSDDTLFAKKIRRTRSHGKTVKRKVRFKAHTGCPDICILLLL